MSTNSASTNSRLKPGLQQISDGNQQSAKRIHLIVNRQQRTCEATTITGRNFHTSIALHPVEDSGLLSVPRGKLSGVLYRGKLRGALDPLGNFFAAWDRGAADDSGSGVSTAELANRSLQ